MSAQTKEWAARKAVRNLQAAIKETEQSNKPPALLAALMKQLRVAQAKLAELTGSTEP